MKTVIIGGHLTPALSVIEEIGRSADILYIGRKYAIEGDKAVSLEYETITKKGIKFAEIKTGRLQRKLTSRTLLSLTKIPIGLLKSFLLLRNFAPDVVVGFGGYVSFPVIITAYFLRIPVVIHEQTLEAGATNRLLARFADKVCISFSSSSKYFPKEKVVLSGNPIRRSILHPEQKADLPEGFPIIYVTGGSAGSHFINHLVSVSLTKILDKYTLVHQTGDSSEFRDFDKLSILKEGLNNNKRERYIVSKFILPEQVGSIIRQASLVVSRSGANTISELIVLEKPAYLIPLPISQKDEQLKNALFLKQLGLAAIGDQGSLTPEIFLREINKMMQNLSSYKIKSGKTHYPKNAAKKIVEVIYASSKNSN